MNKTEILNEMKSLKNNLKKIKKIPGAKIPIKKIEKKLDILKKKPLTLESTKLHEEIISLEKKITGKKDFQQQNFNKIFENFDLKMKEIEKTLQTKKANLKNNSKLKKQKIFTAVKSKKEAENQVKNLEIKLALLNKEFKQGNISENSYEKNKLLIEKKIKSPS